MARPIPNADAQNIVGTINSHVEVGSTIYSYDHRAYQQLDGLYYKHDSVKHSQKEYVRGQVHTNSIESVWAILKRTITGVHHHVSNKHLKRYLNEICFRLNEGT